MLRNPRLIVVLSSFTSSSPCEADSPLPLTPLVSGDLPGGTTNRPALGAPQAQQTSLLYRLFFRSKTCRMCSRRYSYRFSAIAFVQSRSSFAASRLGSSSSTRSRSPPFLEAGWMEDQKHSAAFFPPFGCPSLWAGMRTATLMLRVPHLCLIDARTPCRQRPIRSHRTRYRRSSPARRQCTPPPGSGRPGRASPR